jgi:hypothetical protein
MTDFSKTLVRASAVYGIMVNEGRNGKTPYDKWQEFLLKIALEEEKYNLLDDRKKEMLTGHRLSEKIVRMKEECEELEKHKDDEPELSPGCKSFLAKLYAAEKYGKWSTFRDKGNKYTAKGKLAEQESINLISHLDSMNYVKNEVRIDNDWVSGVPDIIIGNSAASIRKIIDVKTPYDIETFIENLGKPLKVQYWWQVQTYIWLTDAEIGEVSFCLVNTPEYVLNGEKRRLFDRVGSVTEEDPQYKLEERQLIKNLTFDDMPMADRRLRFIVERDDESHRKIAARVEKCREHLCMIEKMHLDAMEFGQYQKELEEVTPDIGVLEESM